jgi:transcriptional regulator with XRE-family HTH domain
LQQSALSHYENGVRRPSFTNLRRLASALGVSTDYLVGHAPPGAARAQELASQIERLRAADRERVRTLVASLLRDSE